MMSVPREKIKDKLGFIERLIDSGATRGNWRGPTVHPRRGISQHSTKKLRKGSKSGCHKRKRTNVLKTKIVLNIKMSDKGSAVFTFSLTEGDSPPCFPVSYVTGDWSLWTRSQTFAALVVSKWHW